MTWLIRSPLNSHFKTSLNTQYLMANENRDWDAVKLGGSVKRNIVNPDLIEERQKLNFDKRELLEFIISKEAADDIDELNHYIKMDPNLNTDIYYSAKSREEQHAAFWKVAHAAYNHPVIGRKHFINNSARNSLGFQWSYMLQSTSMLHLH